MCSQIYDKVDQLLLSRVNTKFNQLDHCDEDHEGCPCGKDPRGASPGKVDLIVLIDSSGSMQSFAKIVSQAAEQAIKLAQRKCETDLRVNFLGLDGTWPGTVFDRSHRSFIRSEQNGSLPTNLAADRPHVGYIREQGANAIEDLSKFTKWREDACRAIFYISDEELDSVSPRNDFANETAETNSAIAEANANNVTVFSHHITWQGLPAQIIQNYEDLSKKTGGKAHIGGTPSEALYVEILSEAICKACGHACIELEMPEVAPCVSIRWGDSECDCLETDDYEVLYITVCNCYTNVTFIDFKIGMIQILDEDGKPVQVLPNGTPSVDVRPVGPFCFGDVAPCKDGEPNCVAREFVLYNKGAKPGKYQIKLEGICYSIQPTQAAMQECFTFHLCDS